VIPIAIKAKMNSEKTDFFGKAHAVNYDKSAQGLAAIKDAIHLVAKIALFDLPDDSNILCVGAGTGAELIALAQSNPGWTFTALDSSEAMLSVCREKIDKAGLSARCDFHHGYIDSLPDGKTYHAATSILVSQFLISQEDRVAFFQKITRHLLPGGYLINADLARPTDDDRYEALMASWVKMQRYNGLSDAQAQASTSLWDTYVSVLEPCQVEKILVAGGFENPLLVFQTFFIHAWVARAGTPRG